MNCTVYLFGTEGEGNNSRFCQYPNDYAVEIFRRYENQLQCDTLLALYRNDNLAYHIYLKKVGNGYIGLCASFNSVWINNSKDLLKVFDETFVDIVAQGVFVNVSDRGKLLSRSSQLSVRINDAEEICTQLIYKLGRLEQWCKQLPPINLAVGANTTKRLPDKATDKDWALSIEGYRSMYANYSSSGMGGQFYMLLNKIETLSSERDAVKNQNEELQKENTKLKIKSKNIVWVGVLSIALVIMFMVLYFKVINPSEVTHYETGEFIYYGPLKDKKPNGVGVAIYPSNDKDGRKYYIGNFVNGKRQDPNAMLIYREGDYYYGSMSDDKWGNGMFYVNSDDSYFRGDFKDNQPYSGTWYEHKKRYELINGEKQY